LFAEHLFSFPPAHYQVCQINPPIPIPSRSSPFWLCEAENFLGWHFIGSFLFSGTAQSWA